jgi:L-aminoadipate-semialdehyde dehydrogenase
MPLNPNGKIDKAALPFPDTAQASLTAVVPAITKGTNTEITMRSIWETILPNTPRPLPTDESFFDLGGHSILATRLIFEIRKIFVVDAPLGLIFEKPTISGLVGAVDALRNADFIGYKESIAAESLIVESEKMAASAVEYGQDYINLLEKLQPSYPSIPADYYDRPLTVFLTGATGFLGAFILHDLLSRHERVKKVICLVRSTSLQQGLSRLREGSTDRGVWSDEWVTSGRLEVVTGDLGLDLFGLDEPEWTSICNEVDVVLHNGALVSFFLESHNICLLPWSKNSFLFLSLGSLGFPIRKIAISKRSRYTDRYQSRLNWKTQINCFRFFDLCH